MSTPGHCDHCWDYCPHVPNTENKWHQATDPFIGPFDAVWADGECPMCAAVTAERERIVAWIRTSIGDEADTGELADDIARGAHLEADRE